MEITDNRTSPRICLNRVPHVGLWERGREEI